MKTLCVLIAALLPALAHAAYTPTATEKAVIDAVLLDEIAEFSEGGGTLIGQWMGVPSVQADVLSEGYAAGASAAAPTSLAQPVLLSGTVAAVTGTAQAGQWASFDTVVPPAVTARLPAQEAKVQVGALLALVCAKLDVVKGVPAFSSCEAASAVAAREVAALRVSLEGFFQGKPTDIQVSTLAINAMMSASLLAAGHGCPGDMARCKESVKSTYRGGDREAALGVAVRKLSAAGVDLSAYEKPGRSAPRR